MITTQQAALAVNKANATLAKSNPNNIAVYVTGTTIRCCTAVGKTYVPFLTLNSISLDEQELEFILKVLMGLCGPLNQLMFDVIHEVPGTPSSAEMKKVLNRIWGTDRDPQST